MVATYKKGNNCHKFLGGVMGNAQNISSSDVTIWLDGTKKIVVPRSWYRKDGILKVRKMKAIQELIAARKVAV